MSENEYTYIGEDFIPPDSVAKVTGAAKYAEDYQFDNILHAKTVKCPYAHALVRDIDTSEAEAMDGVVAIATYEDAAGGIEGEGGVGAWPALDQEPRNYGMPVAAVAAEDEYTAAEAVEAIDVDYEVLGHVIDPVDVLKPGTPNPRLDGNAIDAEGEATTIKWDGADFSGDFPENYPDDEWSYEWEYGDIDDAFDAADHIIEDVQRAHAVVQNPMEPRSNVANWNSDDTVDFYASSQTVQMSNAGLAGQLGIAPTDVNYVANYCGGGFGSKAGNYPAQEVPALLSKEANRPVKMRGTRKEEFYWGNARTSITFKFRVGVTDDGDITAMEITMISEAGGYQNGSISGMDGASVSASSLLQPDAMDVKGVGVFTNTPKKWAHRGPGENQFALAFTATMEKIADELGMDAYDIWHRNAPGHEDPVGPGRTPNSSSYMSEALEQVKELFDYEERKEQSGTVENGKLKGVGIGMADHGAGTVGFDGLIVITPDGDVEVRTGIGNLGTYSFAGVCRSVAETLQVPWEDVVVKWGENQDQSWSIIQAGSMTTFTESFTQYKAAQNAVDMLQELAADEFGGSPDDFVVSDGEVYHEDNPTQSLTLGEAAELAIETGGKYTGDDEDATENINPLTLHGARDAIGEALVAFGNTSNEDMDGGRAVRSFCAGAAEVSVDITTGHVSVEEMVGVTDCGTVVHPQSVKGQVEGGMMQGLGYALYEHMNTDEDTGIPYNTDWYTNKTPSMLDYVEAHAEGVDEPDLFGAYGIKGLGEPPYGTGASVVVSAVYNALGTAIDPPILPNKVLDALENGDVEV